MKVNSFRRSTLHLFFISIVLQATPPSSAEPHLLLLLLLSSLHTSIRTDSNAFHVTSAHFDEDGAH